SFSGQAGVVSSIVNATLDPSIAIDLTMLRVTMSRPSSGSWTWRRASRIVASVSVGIGDRGPLDRRRVPGLLTAGASISASYRGRAEQAVGPAGGARRTRPPRRGGRQTLAKTRFC